MKTPAKIAIGIGVAVGVGLLGWYALSKLAPKTKAEIAAASPAKAVADKAAAARLRARRIAQAKGKQKAILLAEDRVKTAMASGPGFRGESPA